MWRDTTDDRRDGEATGPGVDDEPSIVDAVATSLRYEGFDVEEAATGRAALASAQNNPPDLIVLDIMLPDLDGIEVTRRLRGRRHPGPGPVPHGASDALEDKVAGADRAPATTTSPSRSRLAEIVARTHAHPAPGRRPLPDDDASYASLTSRSTRTPRGVRGGARPLHLTATEFSLLRFFLLNPRRVLSKGQILDHVWHYDFGG